MYNIPILWIIFIYHSKKMKNKTIVRQNQLLIEPDPLEIGSPAWFLWLQTNDRFHYHGSEGQYLAQREQRRNSSYWYAYHKVNGRLEKVYLGKSEQISKEKLVQVSHSFHRQSLLSNYLEIIPDEKPPRHEPRIEHPSFPLSKVDVPMLPRILVSRPNLLEQIQNPLTVIYAPSGFGKSTLLNEWRQKCGFPVAWLTVDKEDNYRSRFFYSVLKALQTIDPEFGMDIVGILNSGLSTPIDEIVSRLANGISNWSKIGRKIGLVLDDFHRIHNSEIFDAIQHWLQSLPSNFMLVISGHNKPPLMLGDMRARGLVTEFDVNDLRFSLDEGVSYLQKYSRIDSLQRVDYEKLSSHAEGWAAGLTLTAMALGKHEDPHRFVETFSGAHIYMREYFMETVLHRSSTEMQNFLLKTSILKNLNADLCCAVTGDFNGAEMLDRLWQDNLFIVRLEQPGWYRYHDLFAEMLQSQLNARFPGLSEELHLKAAKWYHDQVASADAIHHLLATKAWDEAALLIEEMAMRELEQYGEDSRLLRWLQELPVNVVQNHKDLLFVYLRLAYVALPPQRIERFVSHIENNLRRKPDHTLNLDERDMLAEIQVLRNYWAENEGFNIPARSTHSSERWKLLSDLHVVRALNFESPMENERKIVDLYDRSIKQGNLFVYLMAGNAYARLSFQMGQLKKSEMICRQTLETVLEKRGKLPEPASMILAGLSRVFIERNDLSLAQKYLNQSKEVDPNPASFNMPVLHALWQTRIFLGEKNFTAAADTINNLREAHSRRPSGQWQDPDLTAYAALVSLREGNMDKTRKLLAENENISGHMLTQLVQSEFLLRRRQPDLAAFYLDELLEKFPGMIQSEPITDILLLRAISYFETDQISKAKIAFTDVVKSAAQENITRPFLERLDLCQPLLSMSVSVEGLPPQARFFVRDLLELAPHREFPFVEASSGAIHEGMISARELDVLRLLAFGDSNREMAQKLSVSESTIKTHIANIYLKLGVNNRVQAIIQARKKQLL